MPTGYETKTEMYKFIRVEDYFNDYKSWDRLDRVLSHTFDGSKKILSLGFRNSDNQSCLMLLYFPRKDTYRLRFNPGKSEFDDYTVYNTRAVVMDTFDQLCDTMEDFTIDYQEYNDRVEVISKGHDNKPFLKLEVTLAPFQIQAFKFNASGAEYLVLSDSNPGIYYSKKTYSGSDSDDYAMIQAKIKPASAKYCGFGEHGGGSLYKNEVQLTYFNFDNMMSKQVYNQGAMDDREPLYHSNPFFIEFYGVPAEDSVYGIFVDNSSQVFMDLGYLNSKQYMIGTRFGDLDYYVFIGDSCSDIMDAYSSIVGRSRLKPRYALGYHQGCYGYDTRKKLENVAENYRKYQIPIDGLHIDVDIQKDYQTFTIDESRFPDPKGMFTGLRNNGFMCSTNITPIISNKDDNYLTYRSGLEQQFFVKDLRHGPLNYDGESYQNYQSGSETYYFFKDPNYNTGSPYVGEVYYGGDRGTTGHYPDFGRKEVRDWWGKQYKYLFEMGLEMVWQDMTTPCIRDTRGDMRSFPFKLKITDDSVKMYTQSDSDLAASNENTTTVIKVWNLFSYNLHKATYHGLNNLGIPGRENKRNFIIGRGGMHRFAGLWTGDNASSWDFLRVTLPQVLALGISGQAVSGSDVGGFEIEQDWEHWADPELFIRWTTMGAFLPWFRNHYIAKGRKFFQEPYAYQFVDLNAIPPEARYLYTSVLPVCKHYIELRYRLMQLFYDAMFENTINGMPICRTMFLNDSEDRALFNDKLPFLNNQFFVGKDLLIAPVLEKQSKDNANGKRDIYLPEGSDWYSFKDNRSPLSPAVEGGGEVRGFDAHIDANEDHIGYIVPIYVRSGAVIPTIELEQFVGELNAKQQPNPVTLNMYPGQSGQYTMFLDDGVSRSSAPAGDPQSGSDPLAKSEYRETRISHSYTLPNVREIEVNRIHDNFTPQENYFFVAILHDPGEMTGQSGPLKSVEVSGQPAAFISGGTTEERADHLRNASSNAWYYNENIRISFMKVFDNSSSISIKAEYLA
ncbi:hypothetical protein O9H85_37160 [Paenibacillus filicis]|uniref:Alpha-glucosidase n=1 Tax=Paenibacillus gyeongsangnamensis TaxID=3388067 RepID=A0ABT4QLR2_9BACL|nr:TIM-barrel domain-containing protein [Paenibacillus filicis]MCZ8517817.1 hypothetical protein [Paenibacillus filicis]